MEQATGALAAMGYTGEPQDSLVYLRARYYHPALGRFLTPDSIVPDVLNGQDWNAYAYVRNNPVRWVDPSGHVVSTGTTDAPLVSCYPGAFADCVAKASLVMEQDAFLAFLEDHAAAARNFSPTDALLNPIFERLGRWDSVAEKANLYTNLGLWKLHDQTTHKRPITWEPIGLLGMGSVSDLGDSCLDGAEGLKGGGGATFPRFDGKKPRYIVNPAHDPHSPFFNKRKTPLPSDAKEAYKNAIPDDAFAPDTWYGVNDKGQVYRYSADHNGEAHFSGIYGVGDSFKMSRYARDRLKPYLKK